MQCGPWSDEIETLKRLGGGHQSLQPSSKGELALSFRKLSLLLSPFESGLLPDARGSGSRSGTSPRRRVLPPSRAEFHRSCRGQGPGMGLLTGSVNTDYTFSKTITLTDGHNSSGLEKRRQRSRAEMPCHQGVSGPLCSAPRPEPKPLFPIS